MLFSLGNSSDAFLILRAQNVGVGLLPVSIIAGFLFDIIWDMSEQKGDNPVWHPHVLIMDIDGVINWRVPCQKAGVPILGHHTPDKYKMPIREVPADGSIHPLTSNPGEYLNALRHLITPVFPDVSRVLKELDYNTIVFGNTGRPNTPAMREATHYSLKFAGVGQRLAWIYFKPEEQKTVEHKVAVSTKIAEKYGEERILVVDDNPYDLLPQAKKLRKGRFVLIKDFTTKKLLKGIDMASEYPNVVIGKTFRQGLSKAMTIESILAS